MLVLKRYPGESIVLARNGEPMGSVFVSITEDGKIRVAFDGFDGVDIWRSELLPGVGPGKPRHAGSVRRPASREALR